MILLVGKRLRGTYHDGVARVNTNRIDVLHITDGNGGIVMIPHDLVFDFLEALDALLYKHLMHRGKCQGVFHQQKKFFFIVGKAATRSTKRKGGTKHNGISDLPCDLQSFFDRIGYIRGKNGLAETLAQLLEKLSVLCSLNRFTACSEKLDTAFLKDSLFFKLHSQIQSRLTADTGQDRVGALITNNLCDIFQCQRLHIDLIRNGGIRHNRCGVGVTKDDFVALFLKSKARLRSRVVKLCRLTDNDRTGADHKDLFNIGSLRHCSSPPA